jgi:RNA polymerase-interacting CarD/CdnL/TRCF family regulator
MAAVPTIKAKHQGLRRLAAREAVETVVGQSSGM